jgi:hypothetical protein
MHPPSVCWQPDRRENDFERSSRFRDHRIWINVCAESVLSRILQGVQNRTESAKRKHLLLPATGEVIMDTLQWGGQAHYREALLETNPVSLVGRVATAERAIFLRMKELRGSLAGQVERQAIADAINGLSVLKRESAK